MLFSSSETLQVKRGRDVVYIRDFPQRGKSGVMWLVEVVFSVV